MHIADNTKKEGKISDEWLSAYSLLPVLKLPTEQKGQVGNPLLVRAPIEHHRAILDAYLLRRRTEYVTGKGRQRLIQNFCKQLAQNRGPSSHFRDDPLFWMLGIWDFTGPPSHSRPTVESHSFCPRRHALQTGASSPPLSYRAMAAWACRYSTPQYELYALCSEIRNQVRNRSSRRTYLFPSKETASWLAWARAAFALSFPIPRPKMASGSVHRDRWKTLGFGPNDAASLSGIMPEI